MNATTTTILTAMVTIIMIVLLAVNSEGLSQGNPGEARDDSAKIQSEINEQEQLRSRLEQRKKNVEEQIIAREHDLSVRRNTRYAEEAKDKQLQESRATIKAIDDRIRQLKSIADGAVSEALKQGLKDFKSLSQRNTDNSDVPKSTDFSPTKGNKARPGLPPSEESMQRQMSADSGTVLLQMSPALRLEKAKTWLEQYQSLRLKAEDVYQRQLATLQASEHISQMLKEEEEILQEITTAKQLINRHDRELQQAELQTKALAQRLERAVQSENRNVRDSLATIEAIERQIEELTKMRNRQRLASEISKQDANIEQHRMALQREQAKYERLVREHVSHSMEALTARQKQTKQVTKTPPRTMICPRCRTEVRYVSNTTLCNSCMPRVMNDYGTHYSSQGKSGGREKAYYDLLPATTRRQIEQNQDRVREQFRRSGPPKGGIQQPN